MASYHKILPFYYLCGPADSTLKIFLFTKDPSVGFVRPLSSFPVAYSGPIHRIEVYREESGVFYADGLSSLKMEVENETIKLFRAPVR